MRWLSMDIVTSGLRALLLSVDAVVGRDSTLALARGSRLEVAPDFLSADLPVITVDERLSTVEAEARLRESGVQPSRDRGRVDSAAAALILETFLASRGSGYPANGPPIEQ